MGCRSSLPKKLVKGLNVWVVTSIVLGVAVPAAGACWGSGGCSSSDAGSEEESGKIVAPAPLVGTYAAVSASTASPEGEPVMGLPSPPHPGLITTPYARLSFKTDGTYTAKVDVSMVADCVATLQNPCWAPEQGTYSFRGGPGTPAKLILHRDQLAEVTYGVTRGDGTLSLTDAQGRVQKFAQLADGTCRIEADCSAAQRCEAPVCLMMCDAADPNCCPSRCVGDSTAPPPGAVGLPLPADSQ